MIASHYAEPFERVVAQAATLRFGPSDESEAVAQLKSGDPFAMLDNSLGWAWGYGGKERLVGYLRAKAIGSP